MITTIACILLIAGGGVSYMLHSKGEKIRKRTSYLKSDIATLSDEVALLRKKHEPVKQTAEALVRTSKEEEQLQTTLAEKKQKLQQITQENAPAIAKIKVVNQEISELKTKNRPIGNTGGNTGDGTETDRLLVQKGMAYLQARQTGNLAHLSGVFAPRCNYQYADGKEVDNQFIMEDIKKFWDKWPNRTYRLQKLSYLNNALELIYFYECSNNSGKTIKGYTKEMWHTSPTGQIIQWSEVLNRQTPPDATPGYRTLKLNH